jgi:hypothetical protein
MIIKRLVPTLATASLLTLSGLSVTWQKVNIQPMPAVAQAVSCDTKIRNEEFSRRVGSTNGINLRSDRRLDARTDQNVGYNEMVSFDGWAYGQSVNDLWTGKPDALWFRLKQRFNGQERWVPSAYMIGYPPSKPPTQPNCPTPTPGQPDFSLRVYRQDNPFWISGHAPSSTNPPNPKLGNSKGNCTWYANGRSKQLGRNPAKVDKMLGMAYQWATQASAAGIATSRTPVVGAIAHWDANPKTYPDGHVAVVERVNSDKTILISESSYTPKIGSANDFLYRTRTISDSNPNRFILP